MDHFVIFVIVSSRQGSNGHSVVDVNRSSGASISHFCCLWQTHLSSHLSHAFTFLLPLTDRYKFLNFFLLIISTSIARRNFWHTRVNGFKTKRLLFACVSVCFLSPESLMTWSDWIFEELSWSENVSETVGIHYDYKLTSTNDFLTRHWWIITWILIVWENIYSNLFSLSPNEICFGEVNVPSRIGKKFSLLWLKIFIMWN